MIKIDKYFVPPLIFLVLLLFLTVFFPYDEFTVENNILKNYYFFCLSFLVIGVSAIFSFVKKINFSINTIDLLFTTFFIYSFLRFLFTPNDSIQNQSIQVSSVFFFLYLSLKIIFTFTANETDTKYKLILLSFLGIGFVESFFGLLNLYGITTLSSFAFNVAGSYWNHDHLSGFLTPIIPFAFGLYYLPKKNGKTLSSIINFALITFLLLMLVLPALYIRTSWLSVFISLVFVCFFNRRLVEKVKFIFTRRWKAITILLFAVILIPILFSKIYEVRKDSANGRLLIWKVTSTIIKDAPIYGHGYDSFSKIYNNYQADYFKKGLGSDYEKILADNVKHAHNEFLQLWSELGAVGLLLLLALFASIIFACTKNNRSKAAFDENEILHISAAAGIISIIIYSLFSFPLHILATKMNFIFLLALVSATSDSMPGFRFNLPNTVLKFVQIVILITVMFIATSYSRTYQAFQKWEEANLLAQLNELDTPEKIYKDIYPLLKQNGLFLFTYGGLLSRQEKYSVAIPLLEKAKKRFSDPNLYLSLGMDYEGVSNYKKAEACYLQASFMIPHKFYPKYLLTKFFIKNLKFEKAKLWADQILNDKAKVNSTAVLEMRDEIAKLTKDINSTKSGVINKSITNKKRR